MSRLVVLVFLAVAAVGPAGESAPTENSRIEYLLTVIASLPDAQFIRNGKAYDGKAAADHMRTKLRFAGPRVRTAEDFIRYCASQSSLSGQPYEIRFADGRAVRSADFLRQKLVEFDERSRRPD